MKREVRKLVLADRARSLGKKINNKKNKDKSLKSIASNQTWFSKDHACHSPFLEAVVEPTIERASTPGFGFLYQVM